MTYKVVGKRPIDHKLGIQQSCSILDIAANKAIEAGDVDSMLQVAVAWLEVSARFEPDNEIAQKPENPTPIGFTVNG